MLVAMSARKSGREQQVEDTYLVACWCHRRRERVPHRGGESSTHPDEERPSVLDSTYNAGYNTLGKDSNLLSSGVKQKRLEL